MRSLPLTRTDPLGNLTSFAYDTLGRLIQKTYPPVGGAAAVETTAYDDAHDVVAVTDAEGHATATSYDLQHRPAQIQNAARGIKAYQYDAAGNKTLESDWSDAGSPAHDTTFVYDDAERLPSVTSRWDGSPPTLMTASATSPPRRSPTPAAAG